MSITVALVCGSMSITRTFLRNSADKVSARATVVVVLPTPPFKLMVETTLHMGIFLFLSHTRIWDRRNTGPDARSAIGLGKSDARLRQLATACLDTLAIAAISFIPTSSSSLIYSPVNVAHGAVTAV